MRSPSSKVSWPFASGQTRRYAWDYDPQFDLIEWNRTTGQYTNLTRTLGYDAEGSYSPDGQFIAFASNREAYQRPLSEREQTLFANDPAVALDLYVMRADGTDVRKITDVFGSTEGLSFSPDGKRICWRRFSEDCATAECSQANFDGSDAKALTRLGAMSWAPYFHPSGDYLIFATNLQGFANFELYLVDAAGCMHPCESQRPTVSTAFQVFTPMARAWHGPAIGLPTRNRRSSSVNGMMPQPAKPWGFLHRPT
jgi:roadblock/LC7 domain-containing protein